MGASRRAFLSFLPLAVLRGSEKNPPIPSQIERYSDPATEFAVSRLTDPQFTCVLPSATGRPVSHRGNTLFFASDRSGTFQAYRMDVKSGQSRQLTDVERFVPASLNVFGDDKNCCFLAGGVIWQLNLANLRQREMYRIPEGFEAGRGLCATEDGQYVALVEKKADLFRLRLIMVGKGSATTVVESVEEIADPAPRPKRAGLLYRLGGRELHVVNFDGAQNQRLRTAAGRLGPARWSLDGRYVDYLNLPGESGKLNGIREYTPDVNEDRFVSGTTQFVAFDRNSDSSVFVGASGSKASPYVLLLVRAVKRELTLCEHKASDPARVAPIFSPNSQRIFFQSDRHGKWAIYSMSVERLVEETE